MSKNYLGNDSKVITLKMTRKQALENGFVYCKHCGKPPNNHFDFEPYSCAHDKNCPGYEEKICYEVK